MSEKQNALNKSTWAHPNNFCLSIRCIEVKFAKRFVTRGELKFSTPQSWVERELSHGKGRGDLQEGTVAYCNMFDVEKISEFHKKYQSDRFLTQIIGQRLHIKRKRSMELPVFCFYMLKNGLFSFPTETGKQKMSTIIDSSYFMDFADNMTPEQVDELSDENKPAVICWKHYDSFKRRLINKLVSMGIKENEVIDGYITYHDYNKFGEMGFLEFGADSPKELFAKESSFSHQSEARIIIDTNNQDIKDELLKTPIEIGSLCDIAQYKTTYLHKGLLITMDADIGIEVTTE